MNEEEDEKYLNPETNPFIRTSQDDVLESEAERRIYEQRKRELEQAAAAEAENYGPGRNPFIKTDEPEGDSSVGDDRAPYGSDDEDEELKRRQRNFISNIITLKYSQGAIIEAGPGLRIEWRPEGRVLADGRKIEDLDLAELEALTEYFEAQVKW
jgi:hypothetical protein